MNNLTIEYQCQYCKEWSLIELWKETYTECEECGEHEVLICPSCFEIFDPSWGSEIKERKVSVVKEGEDNEIEN